MAVFGLSGKESVYQCRRCRSNPWVGKIPWRRKWQPWTLVWEIPWTEEPGGLQSKGSQTVRHDVVTKQQPWLCSTTSILSTRRLNQKLTCPVLLPPAAWKWSESEVAPSCPTLCNPMDCSLPGSSIHGIFQSRVLEWVATSFSRRSSRPRNWTRVSRIVGRRFTIWATSEVHQQLRHFHFALGPTVYAASPAANSMLDFHSRTRAGFGNFPSKDHPGPGSLPLGKPRLSRGTNQKGILVPLPSARLETETQLHLNESTAPSGGSCVLGLPGSQSWEAPGTRIVHQEGSSRAGEEMWVKGGSEGHGQGEMMHSYFTLELEENSDVPRMMKNQCQKGKSDQCL